MKRPLLLVLLALPFAADAATAGEASPPTVAVTTQPVPPSKGGPSDGAMRTMPHTAPVDLDERAPAGMAAPAPGRVLWAEPKMTGRAVAIALVRGEGDALTVFVDADGDRRLDPATEAVRAQPAPPPTPPGRLSWTVDDLRAGDARATLVVSETVPAFVARVVPAAGAPRTGPQKPLPFGDAVPAGVTKPPALAGTVRWSTAVVGERTVAVAASRGPGNALTVALDANGDGDLSAPSETHVLGGDPTRRGTRSGPKQTGARWKLGPLDVGGTQASFAFTETLADVSAQLVATAVRKGTAEVDGATHALFLVDGDFDGRFGGEDDLWWFGKARDADPKDPRNRLTYANMFEATEAAFGGGKTWRLVAVAADGTATVERSAPVDVGAYLHRRGARVNAKRWFPRFDLEAPVFAEDQKLGPPRPKAARPPEWHHTVDFDEAKAFAKRRGKPLLVDFEADWCVWCKRVDYYTYGDAEVASWLEKFALVKLNVDFDEKRSFDAFDFGGLPAIAAFDAEGRPVRFTSIYRNAEKDVDEPREDDHIPGWSKPERFALHLRNLHAAWAKSSGAAAPSAGGN
jgi:hypothetical protein